MLTLISRFFCLLPLTWALAVARAVGWLWYYVIPVRRAVAHRNIDRVFGDKLTPPEKRRMVRSSFVHCCMYTVECLRLPILDADSSAALIDNTQVATLLDLLASQGKGVIAVIAHIDNWDLLGCSQTVRGVPVHAVLKDIGWGPGARFWQRVRQQTGLGCVAPRRSGMRIVKLLRRNQIVAFPFDQHLPPHRAIVCSFFGQLAATTPAPVRLAMVTGAPIIPMIIVRQGVRGQHRVHCEPRFELELPYGNEDANVRHNTERLNRIVESWVRRWPEQWLWAHKRWKVQDRPEGWDIPPTLRPLLGRPATTAESVVSP